MVTEIDPGLFETQWMYFERTQERDDKTKTEKWCVTSRRHPIILGEIRWYGPWRQYVFAPSTEVATLFNQGCMDDISEFIQRLTREHRQRNSRARRKV